MSIRYIYNTRGRYVGFIQGEHLFNAVSQWLGFLRNGNEVYAPDGRYLGYVSTDDRIIRKKNDVAKMRVLPSLRPLTPLRPLPPLPRLPSFALPFPYEDVFNSTESPPASRRTAGSTKFEDLIGARIVADDGTLLGVISRDRYASASLANRYGPYGSRYSSTSILNPYGPYGSKYSSLSPFNRYATTAPKIERDGEEIGRLTINPYVRNKVDADDFVTWLQDG